MRMAIITLSRVRPEARSVMLERAKALENTIVLGHLEVASAEGFTPTMVVHKGPAMNRTVSSDYLILLGER